MYCFSQLGRICSIIFRFDLQLSELTNLDNLNLLERNEWKYLKSFGGDKITNALNTWFLASRQKNISKSISCLSSASFSTSNIWARYSMYTLIRVAHSARHLTNTNNDKIFQTFNQISIENRRTVNTKRNTGWIEVTVFIGLGLSSHYIMLSFDCERVKNNEKYCRFFVEWVSGGQ